MDVSGTYPSDRSGNCWFVLFVDRKSRFRYVGLMRNKNDTMPHFLSFCESATRQHPNVSVDDLVSIRMDGGDKGGEFSAIRDYVIISTGFGFCLLAGLSPNGNSLAETSIKVVCQKMWASLHAS